jgi:hypothetical protein
MQPESDAGFHGVVPNDDAGGVHDEGVGLEVLNNVSNDQHAPTNRNRVFGDGECSNAQVESFVKFSACSVSNKCTRDGSKPTQNGTRSNQPLFRRAERTSRKSTRKDTNSKPGWLGSVRCAGKFVYNQLADSKSRHEEDGFLALQKREWSKA